MTTATAIVFTGLRPDGTVVYLEETMRAGVERGRTITFLERWRNSGSISRGEYMAAQQFAEDFHIAGLGPRYAMSTTERVDKGHDVGDGLYRERANRRVRHAEGAVGNIHATVLVYVVGHQTSIRECARRINAPRPRTEAWLRGGLRILAVHYGLAAPCQKRLR